MAVTCQMYQLRSNAVVIYNQVMEHKGRRHQLPLPSGNTYSGKVTNHSKKRLLKALDLMVQRSPTKRVVNHVTGNEFDFKMNFVTLTLAEQRNVSASEAYQSCLREWLRYMKKKMGVRDYVWKAEFQQRGQIHYHVATNQYLPWEVVRWRWNQLQYRAGYLEGFRRKYRHINPNGTDVHHMSNVEDCLAYIGKEMCKGIQNKKSTVGKVWDCNVELKRNRFSAPTSAEFLAKVDDAIQHGFAEVIESDHCHIVKLKNPERLLSPLELQRFRQHIS